MKKNRKGETIWQLTWKPKLLLTLGGMNGTKDRWWEWGWKWQGNKAMTEGTGTAKVETVHVDKYRLSPLFSKVWAWRARVRGQMKEVSKWETMFPLSNSASIFWRISWMGLLQAPTCLPPHKMPYHHKSAWFPCCLFPPGGSVLYRVNPHVLIPRYTQNLVQNGYLHRVNVGHRSWMDDDFHRTRALTCVSVLEQSWQTMAPGTIL